MGLQKGTKLTDTPKSTMLRVRVDDELLTKLDKVASEMNTSRSEVVRKGIEIQYEALKKG